LYHHNKAQNKRKPDETDDTFEPSKTIVCASFTVYSLFSMPKSREDLDILPLE
jgi:hypothetical protein